jgi:hypothetical protein
VSWCRLCCVCQVGCLSPLQSEILCALDGFQGSTHQLLILILTCMTMPQAHGQCYAQFLVVFSTRIRSPTHCVVLCSVLQLVAI